MKILILGGTGAMGVPLVSKLCLNPNEIYITSRHFQTSAKENVHFLRGDAHNLDFLQSILKMKFDVIVDFMVYEESDLKDRLDSILSSTKQYIFLSSSRVYAPSDVPLTEKFPRLLDVSTDQAYLATDEYALAKAREEDIIHANSKGNWTIVRPYITYNNERLQLGTYEIQDWLYRALKGRKIVFPKDYVEKKTTLTFGVDVSERIAALVGNTSALGEIIQIATPEFTTWGKVLALYTKILSQDFGVKLEVFWVDKSEKLEKTRKAEYQSKYDRRVDRVFDSNKIQSIVGDAGHYTPVDVGLSECLCHFLNSSRRFKSLSWRSEAYCDKLTGCHTPLREFKSPADRLKYLIGRYTPYFRATSI